MIRINNGIHIRTDYGAYITQDSHRPLRQLLYSLIYRSEWMLDLCQDELNMTFSYCNQTLAKEPVIYRSSYYRRWTLWGAIKSAKYD